MVFKSRLLAVLIVSAAACAPPPPANPPPPATGAVQDDVAELWTAETRAVLSGLSARSLASQCSRFSPRPIEGTWTPSEAEIEAMEDELILLVSRELEADGESPSPGGYYRQIAGYIVGGRRIIYVNGIDEVLIRERPNPMFDWRRDPVMICDGGAITFGVEYDPATRQFSNFAFNGQA